MEQQAVTEPVKDLEYYAVAKALGVDMCQEEEEEFGRQLRKLIWAQVERSSFWGPMKEEVVADVLVKVMRRLPKWQPKRAKVSTFLYWVIRSGVWDCKRAYAKRAEQDKVAGALAGMAVEFDAAGE